MLTNSPKDLLPGDCLLYSPNGFFGFVIAVKSWTWISHVGIYAGEGMSVASRDGIGVNRYPMRTAQLAWVRRPHSQIDFNRGMAWFNQPYDPVKHTGIRGQGYDWLGLLCFTLAVRQGSPDKAFCSEFATRFYRECQFDPFNPDVDADHVAPAEFWESPAFDTIWRATGVRAPVHDGLGVGCGSTFKHIK